MKRKVKILCILCLTFSFVLSACSAKPQDVEKKDKTLVKEIIRSFDKNNELTNYHMVSIVDGKTFDVNIEYKDGQQHMAGSVGYVAQILSHVDMSVVEERQVREFVYKKGEATMVYREMDGIDQYDVSFDNLLFYESAKEQLNGYDRELKDNINATDGNIKVNERDDGGKEYIYSEIYHYVVSADGYLISYTEDGGSNFGIDTLNSAILDYTYCKI